MDRPDRDRERLKEVHQSDLTEGRINQDFLDWLKTKGMSYLLTALVVLCGYFAWVRWQHYRASRQAEAWTELSSARLPSSFEDIAEKYANIGAVPHLARMRAAQQLLQSVQTGKALGAGSEAEPLADLTEPERAQYLERADSLYGKVLEADDQSNSKALLMVTALTGRAAIAESQGDLELARQYHNQAAQRAEGLYPKLADQAKQRAQTVDQQAMAVTLPSRVELAAILQKQATAPKLEPVNLDAWVRDLVMPPDAGAAGADEE